MFDWTMRGRRGAVGTGLALLCIGLLQCDNPSSNSTSTGSQGGEVSSSSSESGTHDTGIDPENPSEWKQLVEEKLEKGRRRDTGAPSSSEPSTACTFFPDSCGEGEACFWTDDGVKRCAPFDDDAEPGSTCRAANDCNHGQQCVGGRPGTCWSRCRPDRPDQWGCEFGEACTPIYDDQNRPLDWGVCRPMSDECTPWPDDSCDIGANCYETRLGRRCLEYDLRAEVGDSCADGATDCNGGQACVRIGGVSECREKCDDAHPCERGSCQSLENRPYGHCRASSEEGGGAEATEGIQGW
jgi:hypothetical protein